MLSVMILDYEDIADYILKNYRNKVVEVGVVIMVLMSHLH